MSGKKFYSLPPRAGKSTIDMSRVIGIDFADAEARTVAWLEESNRIFITRKRMFTKAHYEAVAGIINAQRKKVRDDAQMDGHQKAAAMQVLNDTTMNFVQKFKADNKKFRDLLFIGECNVGAITNDGQE